MTPEIWVKLIEQAPYLAANIVLVYLFIKYNERRDTEWRAMIEGMDKRHGDGQERLATAVDCLRDDMRTHDQFVREHFGRVDSKGVLR